MSIDDISTIAGEMSALLPRFQKSSSYGSFLGTEDQAVFKRLAIEAKSILDVDMGDANDFSINLISSINANSGGFLGGPSYVAVSESVQVLQGAINHLRRKLAHRPKAAMTSEPYVDSSTLVTLREIVNPAWDLRRLVRMCEELNTANEHGCYLSIAMLVRAIVDHIPPIFSQASFSGVANNHAARSIKGSLQHLDKSLRNIADAQLHAQIQSRETLPDAVQVNFRNDLAVLLAEVIRAASA